MADDTQKDGSDSDWDSTLEFTSPNHKAVPISQQLHLEIEDEESALSDESDIEQDRSRRDVIRNVLKPIEPTSQTTSIEQKENNINAAKKQHNVSRPQPQRRDPPANQTSGEAAPPYNFREAVTGGFTPEPGGKGPPGKERKGNTYDVDPTPTPRGIPTQQGSVRSVGSWDDSDLDQDERTLRELGVNFRREKQKEEEHKQREQELEERSMVEDAPATNRSETTWKGWAGAKFGKKHKSNHSSQPTLKTSSQQQNLQATSSRSAPQTPQPSHRPSPRHNGKQTLTSQAPPRVEVTAPTDVYGSQLIYSSQQQLSPKNGNQQLYGSQPIYSSQQQLATETGNQYVSQEQVIDMDAVDPQFDEPHKLIQRDEDQGRYVYYFGHGNLRFYEVNEEYEEAVLPAVADKVDRLVQRVWQEIFALLRIILSIVIWFVVELFRYISKHIFQPLIIGILVTLGDFLIKPFLSALFNGFVQPTSIFFWNVFTGMRHMFRPIGEILQSVFQQLAMLCRSIRLFDINWNSRPSSTQSRQRQLQTV